VKRYVLIVLSLIAALLHFNAAEVYCFRAGLALEDGNLVLAERLANEALRYDPGHAATKSLLSRIHRPPQPKSGKWRSATTTPATPVRSPGAFATSPAVVRPATPRPERRRSQFGSDRIPPRPTGPFWPETPRPVTRTAPDLIATVAVALDELGRPVPSVSPQPFQDTATTRQQPATAVATPVVEPAPVPLNDAATGSAGGGRKFRLFDN